MCILKTEEKMLNFLKFKKEKDKINKNLQYDDEEKALFNISIKDKKEVLSPFYYDEKEVINVEFAGMLDNIASTVPIKKGIHLSLNCDDIIEEDKERYSKAIKNYYENKMLDARLRLKNNGNLILITLILALVSLTGLFLVNFFQLSWIIIEVVDIVAWVFVWEVVDSFVFQRTLIRYDYYRAKSLYESKITY